MQEQIRIATRASQLALWQANYIADELRNRSNDLTVEIIEISTTGDRDQQGDLRSFGGQGVFTSEVQKALLDNRADVAVHSLKDLPTEPTEGLTLAATPPRASRYDVLVLPESKQPEKVCSVSDAHSLMNLLSADARIGTGSPRRQAQLLHYYPDFQIMEIRGNVETRLRKLNAGDYDAIILAEAGLRRLGLEENISAVLLPELMYPAVGQGSLGLECRADDTSTIEKLQQLNNKQTSAETSAERSLLRSLRAGCHAPLGVLTSLDGTTLTLKAVVLSPNGKECIRANSTSPIKEAVQLGEQLAEKLRKQGAARLL